MTTKLEPTMAQRIAAIDGRTKKTAAQVQVIAESLPLIIESLRLLSVNDAAKKSLADTVRDLLKQNDLLRRIIGRREIERQYAAAVAVGNLAAANAHMAKPLTPRVADIDVPVLTDITKPNAAPAISMAGRMTQEILDGRRIYRCYDASGEMLSSITFGRGVNVKLNPKEPT